MKNLYLCSGEMAERSNAAVLKTVVQQCTGGSNPSFSAEMKRLIKSLLFLCLFFYFTGSMWMLMKMSLWSSSFNLFSMSTVI